MSITLPKMSPTSQDVATLAGVSRTQVSYVLSGQENKHVSAEKRTRILDAAKSLGYQPHQSAQALRKGVSNEFGLFFPAPYTPRINSMLGVIHESGLANHLVPTQYSFNSYHDAQRKREAFEAMLSRRPAGFFCSLLDLTEQDIAYARSKGVNKVLLLDLERHRELPTLELPVEQVGYLAAEHLIALGHRRIALVQPADPLQARGFSLRLRGMQRAAASVSNVKLLPRPWPSHELRPTYAGANAWVNEYLQNKRNTVDAIYAFSDDYAFTLLAALKDKGLEVPRDVSIIGTDDHPHGELFRPALTTVRFDSTHMGARAVAMINQLFCSEPTSMLSGNLSHQEPQLIKRQTTAFKP